MKARNKLVVIGALALAAVAALTASAQEAQEQDHPQAEFTGEIAVTEVLLDVLVTDSKGNVVIGLGPEDFEVKDQGEVVDLTSASFYSNRRFVQSSQLAKQAGIDQAVVPSDRIFIIFIHFAIKTLVSKD